MRSGRYAVPLRAAPRLPALVCAIVAAYLIAAAAAVTPEEVHTSAGFWSVSLQIWAVKTLSLIHISEPTRPY